MAMTISLMHFINSSNFFHTQINYHLFKIMLFITNKNAYLFFMHIFSPIWEFTKVYGTYIEKNFGDHLKLSQTNDA